MKKEIRQIFWNYFTQLKHICCMNVKTEKEVGEDKAGASVSAIFLKGCDIGWSINILWDK